MMSGAQTWVLKNEVLEKSNTRFPAPPIKNDLSTAFEKYLYLLGFIEFLRFNNYDKSEEGTVAAVNNRTIFLIYQHFL